MNHILAPILAIMGGFAASEAVRLLPGLIKRKESAAISSALSKLKLPEDKAAFKSVLAAIKAHFPQSSSAYGDAADAVLKEIPSLPSFGINRDCLVSLLQAMEQGISDGMSQIQ